MLDWLVAHVPRWLSWPAALVKNIALCLYDYGTDMSRMLRHGHMAKLKLNEKQLAARLTATAHVIEKGMSLPEPRLGYGRGVLQGLMSLVERYSKCGYSRDQFPYTNALAILRAYRDFHLERQHELPSGIAARIEQLAGEGTEVAGCITVSKNDYRKAGQGNFPEMAWSRYSLRMFSGEPVPEAAVLSAVEAARKTPSVCNRQSWKVYWVKTPELKTKVGLMQNGSRGFGDAVDSFLVVSSDLNTFFGTPERNQCFVDGGLYAMSLLYGLHFAGVGACPLNWCRHVHTDRELRNLLSIPTQENIIMVIAIGCLPDTVRMACSARKTVGDTLEVR